MAARRRPEAWISHAAAAEVIGCCTNTVEHMVALGVIEHRPRHGGRPSLDSTSVRAAARQFRSRERARARGALERASRPRRDDPPNHDEVWVDTETFALMLGWTPVWVARLAAQGRLPATKSAVGKWWFRRADAERYVAARAFMLRQSDAARHMSAEGPPDRAVA